jgi:hypothetical protein
VRDPFGSAPTDAGAAALLVKGNRRRTLVWIPPAPCCELGQAPSTWLDQAAVVRLVETNRRPGRLGELPPPLLKNVSA